ncbi:hypothetical protein [Ciceribacter ferrooxidans]|nr:hypothetical protein [Ciceribacter ferrooxidans]
MDLGIEGLAWGMGRMGPGIAVVEGMVVDKGLGMDLGISSVP